jgi:hypothetical protein
MRSLRLFVPVALTAVVLFNLCVLSLEAQSRSTQPGVSTKSFQLADTGGAVAYPAGWTQQHYANVRELWFAPSATQATAQALHREDVPRIESSVTPVKNHQEALQRLREIEAEWATAPKYVVMGGWPALTRRQLIPKPHEGSEVESDNDRLVMITTAVAAGATVVRMDGFAPEATPAAVIDQMESIENSWEPAAAGDAVKANSEVQTLRASPSLRMPQASSAPDTLTEAIAMTSAPVRRPANPPVKAGATANLGVVNTEIGSESEIAVSTDGTHIVFAQQCRYSYSPNGGEDFIFGGGYPGGGGNCTGGDTSLAYGQSGNFYWETIGSYTNNCPSNGNCNNTQEISKSTDGGQSFSFSANIIDCQVTSGCGFGNVPDQEHIAADRVNAGTSGDQVYAVFRQGYGFGISCSQDSAATWSSVAFHNNGSSDFPRIAVGSDGKVYVITINGNNIELWSFSSCKNGLTLGLNHVTVASGINQVPCPVSGLDRCNNGNVLSSPTVTVDDTNSNHLYAAYAVNTVAPPSNKSFPGNENVLVTESTDGGNTWSSPVQVNQGTSGSGGRRFQPWVCATGGTAYVSWYDRRNSVSGTNDLTDYFSSSAFDSPGLTGGSDFQIDTNGDPQCATGWPCLSRSPNDSESCSVQPQLAGQCGHSPAQNTDSHIACDYSSTVCPGTESCQGGGGCPKYADYTGNACLLGRLYNAWPSATDQPGAASAGGHIVSFFQETVVSSTGTTTTYTGDTSGLYGNNANLSASLVLQGTSVPVVGQTITFTLGTASCNNATNTSGIASCSVALTQTPGPYTVTATFAGAGNYQSSSDSHSFAINQPASITSANATTFLQGTFNSFTVTTMGYPVPSIMESGALPAGVMFVDNGNGTGTLSGTPALGSGGIYNITFTATNGIGSPAVQSFTLTVDEPASFTSANHATFTIGVYGSFTVTTLGFPKPSIKESGNLPNGITFKDNGDGTGTLSGTPPRVFDGGDFSITFTAKNGIGSPAVQPFTIILQQAPAFTSANNATFQFGVPNSFTVTTVGFPTPSITESGTLPPWLTFVDNGNGTATLSGTPAYSSGTFALVLSATNVVTTNQQNFTLTVSGLGLTPSPLSFGFAYLNSSHTLPLTVTNEGSSPVTVSGVTITPGSNANAATYKAVNHCTAALKSGKSCTIDVTFLANATGTLTATLNITDNALGSPQQVALTGNGIDPVAQFSPTKLAFGTEAVGSSTTLPVQLTNSGLTPLIISNIGVTGTGDFTEVNNCPAILSAGMSCTISVTFAPTAKGANAGTLTVTDNVAAGQSTVALTGTGK